MAKIFFSGESRRVGRSLKIFYLSQIYIFSFQIRVSRLKPY